MASPIPPPLPFSHSHFHMLPLLLPCSHSLRPTAHFLPLQVNTQFQASAQVAALFMTGAAQNILSMDIAQKVFLVLIIAYEAGGACV